MKSIILLVLAIFVTSCSSQKIENFASFEPKLKLEDYFVGKTEGTGVFFDRFSNLKRSFVIEIEGKIEGDILVLKEHLKYDDGEIVNRNYKIKKYSENFYRAEADGLVGEAEIKSFGNALQWRYRLKQRIGKSDWTLSFDDWMYLQPTGIILNRAKVSKLGLDVGEVFMSVRKVP